MTKHASRRAPPDLYEVYFIRAERLRLVKIGWGRSASARVKDLQTGSPDKLSLLGVIYTDDGKAWERRLHQHFAKEREHGEWFRLSPRIESYIAECLFEAGQARPGAYIGMKPREDPGPPAVSLAPLPNESVRRFVKRFAAECERAGFPLLA